MENQLAIENSITYHSIDLLKSYYKGLSINAPLIIIGMVFFTIGISLLLRIRANNRAFLSRSATPLLFHYSFIALSLLMVFIRGYLVKRGAPLYLSVFTCMVGIVLCYFLMKWKAIYALSLSLQVFYVLFFVVDVVWRVREIVGDYNYAMTEPVPSGLFFYAWDSYLFFRLFVELVFLAAIYLYSVAYYYDRRILFDSQSKRLSGELSSCPRCSAVMIDNTNYCYSCGYSVKGIPGSVLNIDNILDNVRYCPRCGKEMNGNEKCNDCSGTKVMSKSEIIKDVASEISNETARNLLNRIKTKILIGLLIGITLIPAASGGAVEKLTEGSAAANNDYVETINMAYDDFSVTNDLNWVSSVDACAEELNVVNSRIYQIDLNRISYTDMYYYSYYLKATYYQMWIMSLISDAIHEKNEPLFLEYLPYYNSTVQMHSNAAVSGYMFAKDQDKLQIAINAIPDAVRFYVAFIGFNMVSYILFALGVIILIVGTVLNIKHSTMQPIFLKTACPSGEMVDETIKNDFIREQNRNNVYSALVVIGIIAIVFIGNNVLRGNMGRSNSEASYGSCVTNAFIENGIELLFLLGDLNNGMIPDDKKDEILNKIDTTMVSFDGVESYNNIPERYLDSSAGIKAFIVDLRKTLNELRINIENNGNADANKRLISEYNHQLNGALDLYKTVVVMQTANSLEELLGDD